MAELRPTFAVSCFALALGLLLMPLVSAAQSANQTVSIVDRPLVMRGYFQTARLGFDAPTPSGATLELTIPLRVSSVVNLAESTLTASIDGIPAATLRLADSIDQTQRGEWRFEIPVASGQSRLLELSSVLTANDATCDPRHARDLWVVVGDQAAATWPAAATAIAVAPNNESFMRYWQAEQAPIRLDPRLDSAPAAMLSVLRLVTRMRENQLNLVHAADAAADVVEISIFDAQNMPEPGPAKQLHEALAEAPETTLGGWFYDDSTLFVLARSETNLSELFRGLFDPATRARCPRTSPCILLEGLLPAVPDLWPAENETGSDGLVLGVAELGFANGWQARGSGSHRLLMVWQRPAGWTINTAPQLRLRLRASSAAQLDHANSNVRIEVNEAPLISWTVPNHPGEDTWLNAKLPEQYWGADTLAIAINLSLVETDATPCSFQQQDDIWVGIAPDSGLFIDREQAQWRDIDRFLIDGKRSTTSVQWSEDTSWSQLIAYADSLQRFGLSSAAADRLVWHTSADVPLSRRIALTATATPDLLQWRSDDDVEGLPVLQPLHHPDDVFALTLANDQGTQTLTQHLGSQVDYSSLTPPDVVKGAVRYVWVDERWHRATVAPARFFHVTNGFDDLGAPRQASDAERLLRWVNLLWASVSILVIAMVLRYFWRSGKRASHE